MVGCILWLIMTHFLMMMMVNPYYDAMKDWQDKDDEDEEEGAEDDYYEKFGYFCKDEKILDFADFKRIKGFFYDSDLVQSSGLFYDLNGTETNQFKKFKNIVSFFNPDQANWHAFSPRFKRLFLQVMTIVCGKI